MNREKLINLITSVCFIAIIIVPIFFWSFFNIKIGNIIVASIIHWILLYGIWRLIGGFDTIKRILIIVQYLLLTAIIYFFFCGEQEISINEPFRVEFAFKGGGNKAIGHYRGKYEFLDVFINTLVISVITSGLMYIKFILGKGDNLIKYTFQYLFSEIGLLLCLPILNEHFSDFLLFAIIAVLIFCIVGLLIDIIIYKFKYKKSNIK